MTDRNFILIPKTATITFEVNQTFALLNSLSMLSSIEDYPGMDSRLLDLERALPAEVKQENELLLDGFYRLFFPLRRFPDTLIQFAEEVASMPIERMYHEIAEGLAGEMIHKKHPNVVIPPLEEILAHETNYINHVHALEADYGKDHCSSPALLKASYHLITHLEEASSRILKHFHYLWDHHLRAEWERVEPMLHETVNHFQKVNYAGMSRQEVIRMVTGRDMGGSWVQDYADESDYLTFYPVPHIGPYVVAIHLENWINIGFRPHLPEGVKTSSAALNRSELLVRLASLADDSRLQILELFTQHEELCAQDIIVMLDLSQSAASRHLRQLTATGYLTERRREGAKCYRLNSERVLSTLQAVKTFLAIS